ncbi:hypothetical protein HNY73_009056 [Argiope bruennichi]|uniref:Uncharacterized protein n=1 Tax=Argiope bruennichi TaxID=94029 RepID=A0A8T0FDT8_ARGBR|nr:hypothetical protein HNY73_009056 [Argiope bruennichi]
MDLADGTKDQSQQPKVDDARPSTPVNSPRPISLRPSKFRRSSYSNIIWILFKRSPLETPWGAGPKLGDATRRNQRNTSKCVLKLPGEFSLDQKRFNIHTGVRMCERAGGKDVIIRRKQDWARLCGLFLKLAEPVWNGYGVVRVRKRNKPNLSSQDFLCL